MTAKVRPALVLGCDIADEDRVLVAVVYHGYERLEVEDRRR